MTEFRFDDPDQYVYGTPFAEFARLRREAPFAWHEASQGRGGFWLATRHRHVVAISKDPERFSTKAPVLADPLPRELWPEFPSLAMIADNLMTLGPEQHVRFRPLATALLAPAQLLAMEERVRAVCARIVSDVSGRPGFDFASEVALRIPVEILFGMFLGIPDEDLERMRDSVLAINAMEDPVFSEDGESVIAAARTLYEYAFALFRRLREEPPGPTLLSTLVHGDVPEGVTPEQRFLVYWFPLIAGAFDSTASTIAGGVEALLQHPDQLQRLRDDPSLLPLAVDEMVRWVTPALYFRRTATVDVEFEGHRIRRGDKVVLAYASANRDEEVFADPDVFDVGRKPNRHVSFGYGPHFCPGGRIGSLVVRMFLEAYLDRLAELELDGPAIHTRSAWINRIRTMPVRHRAQVPAAGAAHASAA
jgi:cholest-4-en-3-one 26-monooxygenase